MSGNTGRFAIAGATKALATILLISGVAQAPAQVDLTPVPSTYELDGVKMSNVLFRNGREQIAYCPPPGWRLSGGGTRLTLVPPTAPNADAQVEVKVLAAALPFDEANLKKYVDNAKQFIPRESRNVETLGTRMNPLRICGHDTLAIELKFDAFGVGFRTHQLYLNRGDGQQWVFRFTAPAAGFEKNFEPFRVSLYGLTGL